MYNAMGYFMHIYYYYLKKKYQQIIMISKINVSKIAMLQYFITQSFLESIHFYDLN